MFTVRPIHTSRIVEAQSGDWNLQDWKMTQPTFALVVLRHSTPVTSSVIFQSVIFQSVIFQSCIFHPCYFVRHFPVLHIPVLQIQLSRAILIYIRMSAAAVVGR